MDQTAVHQAIGTDHLATKQSMQMYKGIQCTTAPTVTNWGGNQTCQPKKLFFPKTVEDCQTILKEACERQLPVRCMGNSHSYSRAAMNEDGYLLSMTQMRQVQPPRRMADHDNAWGITVQAGVTLQELDKKLQAHNPPLALPTTVSCASVTVGGMVSMGAFGAMADKSSVSDLVCALTLLNSSGELCYFSQTKDPLEFSAACCSLGLMGIVCDITLKLVPMTDLRVAVTEQPLLVTSADQLQKFVLNADGTRLLYWPEQDKKEVTTATTPRLWAKQFRWTNLPLKQTPIQTIKTDHPLFSELKSGELVLEIPDALHFSMGEDKAKLIDTGVVFKCNGNFANVFECLDLLVKEASEFCGMDKKKSIAVEMRFIRASSKMMSPLYDRDPMSMHFCINLIAISGTEGFDQFASNLVGRLMDKYHAIPQWSKSWENVPDVKKKTKDLLDDRLMQFDHIRRKYDTDGIFMNKTFKGLF
ncbi:hypothetical protein BGZ73_006985 [Actinomortierella ambigua]|nr:hypothetical protein BGZ73_006985 [Actinomortierella ambigua]